MSSSYTKTRLFLYPFRMSSRRDGYGRHFYAYTEKSNKGWQKKQDILTLILRSLKAGNIQTDSGENNKTFPRSSGDVTYLCVEAAGERRRKSVIPGECRRFTFTFQHTEKNRKKMC